MGYVDDSILFKNYSMLTKFYALPKERKNTENIYAQSNYSEPNYSACFRFFLIYKVYIMYSLLSIQEFIQVLALIKTLQIPCLS